MTSTSRCYKELKGNHKRKYKREGDTRGYKKMEKWNGRKIKSENIYREYRNDIRGQEKAYENKPASVILLECRTNNLKNKRQKQTQTKGNQLWYV